MGTGKAVAFVVAAGVGLAVYSAPAPAPAYSGCRINIAVKNTGGASLAVRNTLDETGVKVKGGVWRSFREGRWFADLVHVDVAPGQTRADLYEASFSCSAKRRYRASYWCTSGKNLNSSFSAYYPGPTEWTEGYDGSTVTLELPMCEK